MTDRSRADEVEQPKESFGEIIRTVIYALLIALVFRTVLFQPFSIPSGSMKPTLLIGDYLFVSKYSYGYSKHSLPYGNLLPDSVFGGRLFSAQPERGDVIVFKNPRDDSQDYIKRVIGLPGDQIQMRQGVLHINGAPVKLERTESFIEPRDYNPGREQRCVRGRRLDDLNVVEAERSVILQDAGAELCLKIQFIETLPNGVTHRILDHDGPLSPLDQTTVFVVPQDHYFFVGDNRDNSQDSRDRSRRGVGFVPADNLVGRAEMILLSSDGPFWQFWNWRGDRFFKWID